MPFRGLVAGAVGTSALDISLYVDMLVRARSASALPSIRHVEASPKPSVDKTAVLAR